ncbi:MAG: transglycosylase domain-containing protein [Erysipelotrichaceae bacterium]
MSKEKNTKKPKKKLNGRLILNSVIILMLSAILVGSIGGFFVLDQIVAASPSINLGDFNSEESSKIYDNKGNVVYELGMENRENIEYAQIPQVVIDAFLSIEDSRFFKHNGFDLPRFIKSALENLKSGSLSQGGSTLTMQLVDNVYFANMEPSNGPIESIARKVQEIFMSMKVETQVSKEKILELYLNKINFGGSARGIQKGAQYYFGKDIEQINLSEAAFLAGVINAPNAFNPYYGVNPETGYSFYEAAVERRNTTLDLMLYHGYITEQENQMAKGEELAFLLKDTMTFETDPLLSYIDVVIEEVRKLTGEDPYTTPMDIYTHMDLGAQELADAILDGKVAYPSGDDLFQVGFSLINNQTGQIVALGGGRGYGGSERNNRAWTQKKQPGSSVKPIVEYALAFDYLGYATSHVFNDIPMVYRNTSILLQNADGKYRGELNFKDAVGMSLNTPALATLQELVDTIGVSRTVQILNSMGLDIDANLFDLGYSIGGSNMALTPTQLAGAYQIFSNGGKYIEPHTVDRIVYKDGSETIEPSYEPVQVISAQAAYMMSTLLYNAVHQNYYNLLQILIDSYPVYGKTGTTDWASDGLAYGIPQTAMKDKWMVAYTSEYTVATWAGYDVPVKGKNTYFDTAKMNLNIPGKINNLMLDYTATLSTPKAIARPSGVVDITHVEGVFPYVSAPAGANSDILTTGMIKSQFATLGSLEAPSLESLDSFSAEYNAELGTLILNFAPYKDTTMLEAFDGTQEWDLYGIKGSGKKFFDIRLIYGTVGYKADIYVNGTKTDSVTYEIDKQSVPYTFPESSDIRVCGYYGFNLTEATSNQVCTEFRTPDPVTPPPVTSPTDPVLPPTDNEGTGGPTVEGDE